MCRLGHQTSKMARGGGGCVSVSAFWGRSRFRTIRWRSTRNRGCFRFADRLYVIWFLVNVLMSLDKTRIYYNIFSVIWPSRPPSIRILRNSGLECFRSGHHSSGQLRSRTHTYTHAHTLQTNVKVVRGARALSECGVYTPFRALAAAVAVHIK